MHKNCNDFTLDIKCKVLSCERIYAEFATPLNISEVEDEIKRQYEKATIVFVNDKQINVTEDNAVVSIKLEEEISVVQTEGTRQVKRKQKFYNLDAITGQTGAEIIDTYADSEKDNMGLTTWKNATDGRILKSDVIVAKNYLDEKQIR